jgi:hypothetical protein
MSHGSIYVTTTHKSNSVRTYTTTHESGAQYCRTYSQALRGAGYVMARSVGMSTHELHACRWTRGVASQVAQEQTWRALPAPTQEAARMLVGGVWQPSLEVRCRSTQHAMPLRIITIPKKCSAVSLCHLPFTHAYILHALPDHEMNHNRDGITEHVCMTTMRVCCRRCRTLCEW